MKKQKSVWGGMHVDGGERHEQCVLSSATFVCAR